MYREFIFALLLFGLICLNFSLIDADDKSCGSLKPLEYEFFATKTIYEDARKYLKKVDDDDLPKPFDDDSLEKEDRDLRKDSCVPTVFYFFGRHSARFPDLEDIEKYNKDLYNLIEKIKANEKCSKKRQELISWKSKMVPKHDNVITELGAQEERNIARRFKRIYPEFFDTKRANVKIGVTKKIRTSQTGAQFLQEVDNLNLPGCDSGSLPTNDVDRPGYNLDKVLEASCYKHLSDNYEKPFLDFHKKCSEISGSDKVKDSRIDRVKNPKLKQPIANRVSRKLGFEQAITVDVLDSIYNMCKFENAIKDDSVWCSLFEKKDIQALEYIEDVSSYLKSAYGPKSNPRQSCPLVKDLVETFANATKLNGVDKKQSHFYFSHADPFKKLLATFNLFRDDESFSERRLDEFEADLKIPKKRHWRTSVITPFSANLAFIMYRCEKSRSEPVKFKILATVTERPVKLGGCKDTDCNSEKFFATYDSMRSCNLEQICAKVQ